MKINIRIETIRQAITNYQTWLNDNYDHGNKLVNRLKSTVISPKKWYKPWETTQWDEVRDVQTSKYFASNAIELAHEFGYITFEEYWTWESVCKYSDTYEKLVVIINTIDSLSQQDTLTVEVDTKNDRYYLEFIRKFAGEE